VTNLETPSRLVVRFYNKRGTAEQWIKEGKQAVKTTRLSCHRFRSNKVRPGAEPARLQPREGVAAVRAAAADCEVVLDQLAATTGEDGRRLVKHARYYWLLLAERHLTGRLFGSMVRRITALPLTGRGGWQANRLKSRARRRGV